MGKFIRAILRRCDYVKVPVEAVQLMLEITAFFATAEKKLSGEGSKKEMQKLAEMAGAVTVFLRKGRLPSDR